MAKLYAELTSDKGGRIASKGGNESLAITVVVKGKQHRIVVNNKQLTVLREHSNAPEFIRQLT